MSDLIRKQAPLGIAALRELMDAKGSRNVVGSGDALAPVDRKSLGAFVRRFFGMDIPAEPLCPHHEAPLDYLAASFFDQHDLLVWASRGGGKTMLAAIATILDAVFHYPAKIRVLGGSFDQSDRLADYVRQLLSAHPRLLATEPTRNCVRLVGGSEIRMLAQSQRAVRGQHVHKIRCDEVDLFDSDVWEAVQFATQSRRSPDGEAVMRGSIEVLSTLHRPGGLMQKLVDQARERRVGTAGYRLIHWCLWEVIERCPPWRRCEDCPLADDCGGLARRGSGYFSIDDAIAIKARSSRSAWSAEMLCRGTQRDDAVFGQWDRAGHVGPVAYCADWPLYRAIDFGYTSPLVCLWIQVSPGGCVHVLDEYVQARLPLGQHAVVILARDPGPVAMTYVDPAGHQKESTSGAACTDLLAAAGIACNWRASSIAEGLELIRAAMAPAAGEPALLIDPTCRRLIEAFENYHYPPPGSSAPPDKPVKDGPDHFIDALRYFFVNRARPKIAIRRGTY